jgi:hypothetical protein
MTGSNNHAGTPISRAERQDLLKIARLRQKVAISETGQREAELRADFEQQLASIYSFDNNETWAAAAKAAQAAAARADSEIKAECQKLGIPARFAPGMSCLWYGRGENASAQRRVELRKVATTRIAAIAARARAEIERASAAIQSELLTIGMSDEARALLDKMPNAQAAGRGAGSDLPRVRGREPDRCRRVRKLRVRIPASCRRPQGARAASR